MKILRWTMVALMGTAVLHACTVKNTGIDDDGPPASDDDGATTGSGTGGAGTGATGTATTGAMSSTGTSMNDCSTSNVSGDTACEPCIQQSCCTQIQTHSANPADGAAAQALQQCAFDAGCSGCQYILCSSEKAIFVFKNLADCINTNCCDAFTACDGDANCGACLTGGGTDCMNDTLYIAYTECIQTNSCGV